VSATPHTEVAGMAHSTAARARVEALMRVLAIEWPRFGINCMSVAAGVVATDASWRNTLSRFRTITAATSLPVFSRIQSTSRNDSLRGFSGRAARSTAASSTSTASKMSLSDGSLDPIL
jgi:NAD(P)-dependent dehydrogenase (short-subunit alcohol dehydrogenase family)